MYISSGNYQTKVLRINRIHRKWHQRLRPIATSCRLWKLNQILNQGNPHYKFTKAQCLHAKKIISQLADKGLSSVGTDDIITTDFSPLKKVTIKNKFRRNEPYCKDMYRAYGSLREADVTSWMD
jgi:hypothetical protein